MAATTSVHAGIHEGLVAYYCFDDVKDLGKDCSTNGNNGTLEGNIKATSGYRGRGALFGGVNDPAAVHIPNSSSLQFQKDFSVSAAVKINNFYGINRWGDYGNDGIHSLFAKSHDRQGVALITYGEGSAGSEDVLGAVSSFVWDQLEWNTTPVAPNSPAKEWVHLTWVFSNTKHVAQFYADGVLIAADTHFSQDFSDMNTQDLFLGKFSDQWYPLNGVLDEVRVYNRALTKTDVALLYQQGGPLGGMLRRFGPHTVTCTNTSTRQSVTIPLTVAPKFNCEAAGLSFMPGQNVTITIDGKTR